MSITGSALVMTDHAEAALRWKSHAGKHLRRSALPFAAESLPGRFRVLRRY